MFDAMPMVICNITFWSSSHKGWDGKGFNLPQVYCYPMFQNYDEYSMEQGNILMPI